MVRAAMRLDDEGRRRVTEHRVVAERMARARWGRAKWIDLCDLEGAASLGLCRAALAWKGRCPFELFAVQMIDYYLGEEVKRWRRATANVTRFYGEQEFAVAAPTPPEDDDSIQAAFCRLPHRDKDVLTRVVLRGQSFSEAGEAMEMTRWAVASALRTAKRRLRKLLASADLQPA